MAALAKRRQRLGRRFRSFREVLAVDGTLIRLHDALAPHYSSVWTHYMKASAKLHMVMNVVGRGARSILLTDGSRQDVRLLEVGDWVRGRLLVFDLAYFKFQLFEQIDEHGGRFLSRLKQKANPRILRGDLAGKYLREVVHQLSGTFVDFDVEVTYGGGRRARRLELRVIGHWYEKEKVYRFYLTNVPRPQLAAEHVAAVYAARWEIELLFREIKVHYRIEQLPTRKLAVAQCLIYAALLALCLSRKLRSQLVGNDRTQRYTFDRWAIVFAHLAADFLELACGRRADRARLERRLCQLLAHEVADPNIRRLPLAVRAQHGLLRRAA